MSSPTQRTKALLQSFGWSVGIVERWNPHARIRQDLFGFIDMVAISGYEQIGTIGVQATSAAHVSERCDKVMDSPDFHKWLSSGNRMLVIGWSKKGARGKRKLWTPKIVELRHASRWPWSQDEIQAQQVKANADQEVQPRDPD